MARRLVRTRPSERRLATVLAADVAGYSRLMGADEEGTLKRLKSHRRHLIDPALAEHSGRLVKTTGDGLLVEFASPVQAVRCAVAIQQGMQARNADEPANRTIEFRIGINLGDIIVEERDIFGDGVNIAARLETLAPPGGIVISRTVRDHIRDRLPFELEDIGPQAVKNIARPVRSYRVIFPDYVPGPSSTRRKDRSTAAVAGTAVLLVALAGGGWWGYRALHSPSALPPAATEVPSVPPLSFVVLPFSTPTDDPDQDYLGDSATEALTGALSKLPGSLVISPATAFTYKNVEADPVAVGRTLNVRYAVQGKVSRSGNRTEIEARLTDTISGEIIWSERFAPDRMAGALVQDGIPNRIARALQLGPQVTTQVTAPAPEPKRPGAPGAEKEPRKAAPNAGAIDLTMRANALLRRGERRDYTATAREQFEKALATDDTIGPAWVGLARTHIRDAANGWSPDKTASFERAEEALGWALAIDNKDGAAHSARATLLNLQGKFQAALGEALEAIELSPNDAGAHAALGLAHLRLEQPEPAVEAFRRAIRLSPRDPAMAAWLEFLGWAQFVLGRDAEAVASLEQATALDPYSPTIQSTLAALYALGGDSEKSRAMTAKLATSWPQITVDAVRAQASPSPGPAEAAARDRLYAGLRDAGVPEGS